MATGTSVLLVLSSLLLVGAARDLRENAGGLSRDLHHAACARNQTRGLEVCTWVQYCGPFTAASFRYCLHTRRPVAHAVAVSLACPSGPQLSC